MQKTANTLPRPQKSATAITTHISKSDKIQTPTQVRHTKGPLPNVSRQEGPDITTPPTEEAHSDDSSSVQLDPDDQPGPSWASGQLVPLTQAQPTTDLPPSGNTSPHPAGPYLRTQDTSISCVSTTTGNPG
ncbi:hypothetical protein NDU88_007535 [Pleurodeles waltl]|uniref:Uncharacterized protein n=1 Tax=Pleurodeles waltl TaxID=8319 RepID=A0AAV7VUR1_PLEWA|nr:hypothetical protein NDU88_007535 [Pleurodeles waltl]